MSFRLKGVRHEINQPYYLGHEAAKKKPPIPPTALRLTLSHGVGLNEDCLAEDFQDIVIMQGRELRKRYHHLTIPHGLRVAATARSIT